MGRNWEVALLAAVFAIAIAFAGYQLGRPFIGIHGPNEAHYASIAANFQKYGLLTQADLLGVGDYSTTPLVPWMIFASWKVFGQSEFAARIPILLCGIGSLALFWFICRRVYGAETALVALLFAATAPSIAHYSSAVQLESPMAFCIFASIAAMMLFKESGKRHWFWGALALFALSMLVKISAAAAFPAVLAAWYFYGKRPDLKKERRSLLLFALPFIPALAWTAIGFLTGVAAYYERFGGGLAEVTATLGWLLVFTPLNIGAVSAALLAAFILCSIPEFRKAAREHALMLSLAVPWYALILAYVRPYMGNLYYDYVAWYAFCALAAVALWRASAALGRRWRGTAVVLVAAVALAANAYAFLQMYDVSPLFPAWGVVSESAAKVNALGGGNSTIVVDSSVTAYYTNPDPAYSRYLLNPLPENYSFGSARFVVLFFYCGNQTLTQRLNESGYVEIAPCAWQKG